MPGDVRISSAENVSSTHRAKSDVVVAFLALGSIGDCLPLCAIAASYRLTSGNSCEDRSSQSRCRPSYDQQQAGGGIQAERRQSQQQQQQQSKAEVIGTDGVARKDDRNFKRRREEVGTVEKTRLLPSSSPAAASAASSVAIVTHRCHCDLLRALMQDSFDVDQPPPRLYPVDLPVLFETTTTTSTTNQSKSVTASAATGQHGQQQQGSGRKGEQTCEGSAHQEHRTEERHAHDGGRTAGSQEPAAAASAAAAVAASGHDEHGDGRAFREMDACMSVLEGLNPKALVFNLYSAFGYHIADVLRIPCLCTSPGVVPSDGGGVPLRRVLPRSLLRRIDERMDAGDADGDDAAGKESRPGAVDAAPFPPSLPAVAGKPGTTAWMQAERRQSHQACCSGAKRSGRPRTARPNNPAALGKSEAEVCGFWSFPRLSPRYRPPDRLARFLSSCEVERRPVFVVGLGSMPALGLVEVGTGRTNRQIVSMAVSSLLNAGAAVVLLPTPSGGSGPSRPPAASQDDVGGDATRDSVPPLAEKAAGSGSLPRGSDTGAGSQGLGYIVPRDAETESVVSSCARARTAVSSFHPRLVDLTGEASFVPHQWLLPRCRGVVHHGGSGTTGAALSAGCVQVVIPLAFDQFFFADQVEYMGVGVRVPGTRPPTKRRSTSSSSSPPPSPLPPPHLAPPGPPPSPAATASAAEINDGGGGGGWVTAEGIENAIRRVLSPSEGMREAARRYRDVLREEREENGGSGGVGVACAKIAAMAGSGSIRKAGERD
ncbi:unnamed protein product [Scytosiphon promiscuus]